MRDSGSGTEDSTPMLAALVRLRQVLQDLRLPLDTPDVEAQRASRQSMIDQLEGYVLPRLTTIDAPLLVVVGGSTGAGKSTLVNSLVGSRVTETGVLRPTTRSPVLVHHPDDGPWFGRERLLADLERVSGPTNDPGAVQVVVSETVPAGLAVLDAPDIDSIEQRNRELAVQLLAAADLWLFVTSAARYADQVPWDLLRQAAERATAVAVVLDRTPPESVQTVSTHLARMLASRGLKDSPLFAVREAPVSDDGLLPAEEVAPIREWLRALAADADAREAVVRQTLEGAIRTLARRSYRLSDAAKEQLELATRLRTDADAAYAQALDAVMAACADGTLLRGEVLARWQEFVGTGELLKVLEVRVGWLRDRFLGAVKGEPRQAERITVAVESGLETLVLEHAETAAERAAAAWQSTLAGRTLLAQASLAGSDLGRATRDLRPRVAREVRDWQQDVVDMVRTEGADRRGTARVLAYGVNALAVALMVVVFASTAGLTGAEIGIAGGSAVLGQKLLEAVFGDQAVRTLAERSRQALEVRVRRLLDAERGRYDRVVSGLGVDSQAPEHLRDASRRIDDLRYAATDPTSGFAVPLAAEGGR